MPLIYSGSCSWHTMSILLEDTFEVKELDPEGKKFDLGMHLHLHMNRGARVCKMHEQFCKNN